MYNMKPLFFVAALVLVACQADVPATYSIDPGFSAAHQEVIRDVAAAWCAHPDHEFCPTETAWGESDAAIHFSANYAQYGRNPLSCAYTNRFDGVVRVNADRPECHADLHMFWRFTAHEWGHLSGLDGHGHGLKLMAAEPDAWGPLAIE
jgi:hypothetical protein